MSLMKDVVGQEVELHYEEWGAQQTRQGKISTVDERQGWIKFIDENSKKPRWINLDHIQWIERI